MYIAIMKTTYFLTHGFGKTKEEAIDTLINQWNEFFEDNVKSVSEFACPIDVFECVSGFGGVQEL